MAKKPASKPAEHPPETPPAKAAGSDTPPPPPDTAVGAGEIPAEEKGWTPELAHKKRGGDMKEVVARQRMARDAAIAGEPDPNEVVDDEELETPPPASGDIIPPGDEAPAGDESLDGDKPPPLAAKRKYLIDGQEVELSDEQITAFVQKGATADKRLNEATLLLERAKATSGAPPSSPPPSARPSSRADVGVAPSQDDVQRLTKSLMYGTEEEVGSAVATLLGVGRAEASDLGRDLSTRTEGLDQAAIFSIVNESIAFHAARDLLERSVDQGGYGDLWSDPQLRTMFMSKETELRNAGDVRPYRELYGAIGTEVRKWRDDLVSKHAPQPPPTGLQNRQQLKAQTGVVRGAGGRPPPPPPPGGKPLDRTEKLEKMRVARGQA